MQPQLWGRVGDGDEVGVKGGGDRQIDPWGLLAYSPANLWILYSVKDHVSKIKAKARERHTLVSIHTYTHMNTHNVRTHTCTTYKHIHTGTSYLVTNVG